MRLKPNLPPTSWGENNMPKRGYGPRSIPSTLGVAGSADPLSASPSSACFWTKEMVRDAPGLEYQPGRLFLGRLDQKMIGVEDNRHIVTIAGARAGKTSTLLIPNLKLYEGSALVIDPKGELAATTAADRAAMGHVVHVLDPWGVSGDDTAAYRSSFDPLADLRDDRANLIENAELVADALIIGSEKDAHWTDSARALIRALVLWIAISPREGRSSLADLPNLIAQISAELVAPDKDGDAGTLKRLSQIDLAPDEPDAEVWSLIRAQALMLVGTPDRERGSILSTARTQLVFLDSPSMARAVASSALVLAELKRRPSTVYLCLPASRMGTHSRWLRLIINLAMASLEGEPWRFEADGKRALPVLFVLEEFAALGHMAALEKAVAYMGGFGVKLWVVLQDLTQLKRHYKEGWETFLGNAGIVTAFSVADQTTCEYLSKRLGETTLQITNKQDVGSAQAMAGDTGLRREFKTQALMTPDEIAIAFARKEAPDGAPQGRALILLAGKAPLVIDRVFYGDLTAAI